MLHLTVPGPLLVVRSNVWEIPSVNVDDLTPEQRAFVAKTEPLWQRAHRIVASHPDLDVTDVFHALRNLERTPSERLRRALKHGRPRAHAG